MRFPSLRLATTAAALFLLAACSGGGDGGGSASGGGTQPPQTPVPTTVTITSAPVVLDQLGATATVTATVLDQNGALISNPSLTFTSSNSSVATVSAGGVVTATGDGVATITVRSGSASADTPATVTISVLAEGQPISGISQGTGTARLFTFELAPGAGAGKVLEFGVSGADGDADIIVRFGSAPAPPSGFDCASLSSVSIETCAFANPQSGTWFVSLEAFAAFTNLTLTPRLVDVPTATDGVPLANLSAGFNEFTYVTYTVPGAAAPPQATNAVVVGDLSGLKGGEPRLAHGTSADQDDAIDGPMANTGTELTVTLAGGTGDADLFGLPGATWSRTGEVPPCLSNLDGNAESCVVAAPAAGPWVFALFGFQPFNGVTLTTSFDAGGGGGGPTPGTLSIQKQVQSSTGGAADNPANPTLSGFQFEIRPAGGGAVLTTVTTDATGAAQASLAPGSYDVTESNAQGLTDVTSTANGVTVTEGGNTPVNWINRQAAPPVGNQPPIAIINASPPSVPSGDNNATSVRLYAGNSSDPDGDPVTYQWSSTGGTFVGSQSQQFARMTFPGGTTQTVTLTVSDGEAQTASQVQINGTGALPPAGTFNIELVPVSPITDPDAQAAFDAAEATWEAIIREDLPDVFVDRPEDSCFGKGPAFTGTVDDVRIYIEFTSIDGPGTTLASAGPCFIRTSPRVTPIIGLMSFDSDDFGSLSAESINRVILHEMAHVLGFGTLWDFGSNDLLINPSCAGQNCDRDDPPGPDTRFVGEEASEAYRSLGGGATSTVPVENGEGVSAGPGTRDGHWREVVFNRELMTGFLSGNVLNPLSLLTIASLRDMGYEQLDFSQADEYSLSGSAPADGLGRTQGIRLVNDMLLGPIYGLDAEGNVVLWRPGR